MSWLSKGLKKIERGISNKIPHEHSADKRHQNALIQEQISLYQQQLEMAREEAANIKEEKAEKKKGLERTRSRQMRRATSSGGFLDQPIAEGLNTTLGA